MVLSPAEDHFLVLNLGTVRVKTPLFLRKLYNYLTSLGFFEQIIFNLSILYIFRFGFRHDLFYLNKSSIFSKISHSKKLY